MKVKPKTNPPYICYTSTQNTSIVTVEEGEYDETAQSINLKTKDVARSSFNKAPEVKNVMSRGY